MNQKLKYFLLSVPVFLILAAVLPFLIAPALNNAALGRFSGQLTRYSLPRGTEIVETHEICGKLNGNGNGMDFMAAMLVKSTLSAEELKAYYAKTGFESAKKNHHPSEEKIVPQVVIPSSQKLESPLLEHGDMVFEKLQNVSSFSGYYVILLFDGGYPADFDLRGH